MGSLKDLADRLNEKGINVEYIGPQVNHTSYMLHRFVRFFLSRSTTNHKLDDNKAPDEGLKNFYNYIEKTLSETIPVCFKETEYLISLLRTIDNADEQRIKQYYIIRDYLNENELERLFANVFALVYDVFESDMVKAPVMQILLDNYGLFITKILGKKSRDEVVDNLENYLRLKSQLLLLAVLSTPKNNIYTWHNDLTNEIPEKIEICETDTDVSIECNQLSNMIVNIEPEIYDKLENANFIPWYYSDDEDYENTSTGNMITFDEENGERSITYQIVDQYKFNSYQEMFFEMGTKCFGFPNASVEIISSRLMKLFDNMTDSQECLALFVIKV